MTRPTYSEQLRDPRWQRKRLEVLQRDDFTCQHCYDSESTLHVHHKRYLKGRLAWEYDAHELVTLCEECHHLMHAEQERLQGLLAKLANDGPGAANHVPALVAGWAQTAGCPHNLIEFFSSSPYQFMVGEVAALLEAANIELLMQLSALLGAIEPPERRLVLQRFADLLQASETNAGLTE